MSFHEHQEIIGGPALRGLCHPRDDEAGDWPLSPELSPEGLPCEGSGDHKHGVEVPASNILERDAAQTTPEPGRVEMEEGSSSLKGKVLFPAPDRLMQEAHCHPWRDRQQVGDRWGVLLGDSVKELVAGESNNVRAVHVSSS
jgi:hypothetical protein